MRNLKTARGAFADLLNALDEARADVTEPGEDVIDALVADIERAARKFDAAFDSNDDCSPRAVADRHIASWTEGSGK